MRRPRTGLVTCVRVRFQECDPLGHVNNTVYLGYLEQAAIDHATAVGWPGERLQAEFGAVFVARRHEIDFLRPARENDVLEIATWPEDMAGARAFRRYEARKIDADPLELPPARLVGEAELAARLGTFMVRARTEWAFVDLARSRPVRIPAIVTDDFLME